MISVNNRITLGRYKSIYTSAGNLPFCARADHGLSADVKFATIGDA